MAVPRKQIRALWDTRTITVYQAYSPEIADVAVSNQKLNASSSFSTNRMTWIKPSWCWMMYRCGYSYKDPRQTKVLALTMTHDNFIELLRHGQLAEEGSSRVTGARVIVQWDPERGPRLEKYDHRSIQIGISRDICERWVEEWIDGIEDVTWKAREMKSVLDDDGSVGMESLIAKGLMPTERPFDVPEDIQHSLGMVKPAEDLNSPVK